MVKHSTWMAIASEFANRECKCVSRKVGAVIVKDNHIVSTGYNGTPSGHLNCCDVNQRLIVNGIVGNFISKEAADAHHQWSLKNELHAEWNAIMSTSPEARTGATLYCTLQPCITCSMLLCSSGISTVIYSEVYPKTPPEAIERLLDSNIDVYQLVGDDLIRKTN